MQRALSTYLLVNHRLTNVWLDRIWEAGIPLVELFCARQHLDYHNRAQIAELGHWFRESELKLHSLHSPLHTDEHAGRSGPQAVINITEPVKSKRISMLDEIKRALEVAETIPCRYLIQHIGVTGQEYDERSVEAAFTALEEISLFAHQRGVEVLLENTPNDLASAERLLYFLNTTHLKLNVCLDVGHAHMNEGVESAYRSLKNRIRSTHIHDNNGKEDMHLFPTLAGQGNIDWGSTMQLLRSQENRYPLLLELREVTDMGPPFDTLRTVFDTLENLNPNDES
ncbi:MAG: sugar phosphate isomerase/epimerase family protein [Acidobacteriota bacterium]